MKSESTIQNGVEVGRVWFDGKAFDAFGSVVDEEHGVIVGYPRVTSTGYMLTTWAGAPIAELRKTGKARGFNGSEITCWAMTYGGKRYSGRNAGEEMVLRLRTKV